jgi:hypothetical protein
MKPRFAAVAFVSLVTVLAVGCESTQDKSAKLEAQGAGLAKVEQIKIGAANQALDVTGKTLLTDQYGTALVVGVKNSSPDHQVDVPIAVNVKNAKGRSIYKNNIEGLEHGLIKIPLVEAQDEVWWVNDQVLITDKAKSADVTIGKSDAAAPRDLPEIEISEPKLEIDPVSGINATGEITNRSDVEQIDLLVYAVATKGGKVVAAGRGLIPKLKTDGKPEFYNVYFIGDPRGADVEVFAPPSNFE